MANTLQTKGFSQIVGQIAAGMQGRVSSRFLNFALGSVFRALAEAVGGVLLWFQAENLKTAKLTRLATSYGSDLDSFIADFPLSGVTRFGAQAATTIGTFSRYTSNAPAVYVPVGGQTKTGDGTQVFQVYADTTNRSFVASYGTAGGYIIPAQVSSVRVPMVSTTNGVTGAPGANGNVAAGAISLISSNMPGVDTVTNVADVTDGFDSESDDSVKARFALAVQGRGGGTTDSIRSAIANIKAGMTCVILENQTPDGTVTPGFLTVFVDDGSGNLSDALLTASRAAVGATRAAGIQGSAVQRAKKVSANVVMQLVIAPGYVPQVVRAQVAAALASYINGLGQETGLAYFNLPGVARSVPGVSEIVPGSYKLNGGTADMIGTPSTTIKTGSLVIS